MPVKLSPSRLDLFVDCERCFWLHVNEGIERPSGPFPSLPTGMDEEIKDHFDRFRQNGELPPELRDTEIDAELVDDEEFLADVRDWRSQPKYRDEDLGVVVRGGVDDLLRAPDGSLVVLDYKTRGYSPDDTIPEYYARQINLYTLILHENNYPTADVGLLLYYYPSRVTETGEFVFHNELRRVDIDRATTKRFIRDAVNTLEGPIPEQNPDCDFCTWDSTIIAKDH